MAGLLFIRPQGRPLAWQSQGRAVWQTSWQNFCLAYLKGDLWVGSSKGGLLADLIWQAFCSSDLMGDLWVGSPKRGLLGRPYMAGLLFIRPQGRPLGWQFQGRAVGRPYMAGLLFIRPQGRPLGWQSQERAAWQTLCQTFCSAYLKGDLWVGSPKGGLFGRPQMRPPSWQSLNSGDSSPVHIRTIGKLGYIDRTTPHPRWVSGTSCPSP